MASTIEAIGRIKNIGAEGGGAVVGAKIMKPALIRKSWVPGKERSVYHFWQDLALLERHRMTLLQLYVAQNRGTRFLARTSWFSEREVFKTSRTATTVSTRQETQ